MHHDILCILLFSEKTIGGPIGDMGGFSYMEFIVPGLIMMSAITSSYANVFSASSFFSLKNFRKHRRNLVAPVPTHASFGALWIGGVGRSILVGSRNDHFLCFCTTSCVFMVHGHHYIIDDSDFVFVSRTAQRDFFAQSYDDASIVP